METKSKINSDTIYKYAGVTATVAILAGFLGSVVDLGLPYVFDSYESHPDVSGPLAALTFFLMAAHGGAPDSNGEVD